MADDDLDMLQQLLEMADDDCASDRSDSRKDSEPPSCGLADQASSRAASENVPPNKRPRLTPAAKPLAAAFQSAGTASAAPGSSNAPAAGPQARTGAVETFSGLRMKNPCLPSVVLKERLSHVRFEKLSQVRSRVGSDAKWATIATVTEKSTKESSKGSAYGIWRLSDLQGTNVSLFLFGKAQTGLWKETEGSVVALFDPEARIADNKLSMSVHSEQQVVKLGTSTDMGFCRSRKKDGTPCRNAVNINTCPFCDYHVQSEYNKIRSKRTECKDSRLHRAFQYADGSRLGSSGRPKMSEGGDIVYSQPAAIKPRSQQQLQKTADKARKHIPGVSRLLAAMVPGQPADQEHSTPAPTSKQYGPGSSSQAKHSRHARHHHTTEQQSKQNGSSHGSQQLPLRSGHQGGPSALPPSTARKQQTSGAGVSQSAQPSGRPVGVRQASRAAESAVGHRAEQGSAPVEPARVLILQEDEVDWGSNGAADPALQHALAVIHAKGGLTAPDPNRPFQSRPSLTPPQARADSGTAHADAAHKNNIKHQQDTVADQRVGQQHSKADSTGSQPGRSQSGCGGLCLGGSSRGSGGCGSVKGSHPDPQNRVLAKLGLGKEGQLSRAGPQARKIGTGLPSNSAPSGFAAAFGSVGGSRNAEHSDTRYKDLVDDEDHERLTRVLTALEKKDDMQQRMEAITKLNVTAFQCKTCSNTTERRRLECQGHDVQLVTATKRWWQCCHCNNRFSTVAVRLPKDRCPKCNDINMEFKAATMARSTRDKTDHSFASREAFKARGVEHAFALNSQH